MLAPRLRFAFSIPWFTLAALSIAACSNDGGASPVGDAGAADAEGDGGADDAGAPDEGPLDRGPADRGASDAGGTNPEIITQGLEQVGAQRLYIEGRGTTTSTHNPVLLLSFQPWFATDYLRGPTEFLLGGDGPASFERGLWYVDLFAQGRSGISSDDDGLIAVETQVRSVRDAIDHIRDTYYDADTQFDVIGHGYGALMAALHEARRSGDFDDMVLVAPYPIDIDLQAEWIANYKTDPRFDGKALADLEVSPRCGRDTGQCEIDQFAIYGLSWVCQSNQEAFFEIDLRSSSRRTVRFFIELDLRNREYDYRSDLALVGAQTTIVTGACDQIPEANFEAWTDQIPEAQRVHLDEAGFFPMHETPERWKRIVREAISDATVNP